MISVHSVGLSVAGNVGFHYRYHKDLALSSTDTDLEGSTDVVGAVAEENPVALG